jgi:hypothetical protein
MLLFWVVMPCRPAGRCQCFRETYSLHFQLWRLRECVSLNCWYLPASLYDVISQNNNIVVPTFLHWYLSTKCLCSTYGVACVGECTFRTVTSPQRPVSIAYVILSLTASIILTVDMIHSLYFIPVLGWMLPLLYFIYMMFWKLAILIYRWSVTIKLTYNNNNNNNINNNLL